MIFRTIYSGVLIFLLLGVTHVFANQNDYESAVIRGHLGDAAKLLPSKTEIDLLGDKDGYNACFFRVWYSLEIGRNDSFVYWYRILNTFNKSEKLAKDRLFFSAWYKLSLAQYDSVILYSDSFLNDLQGAEEFQIQQALALKGSVHRVESDYVKAHKTLVKRKIRLNKTKNSILEARCEIDEGNLLMAEGRLESALELFRMTEKRLDTSKKNILYGRLLSNIAKCNWEIGNEKRAYQGFKRSKQEFEFLRAEHDLLKSISNLAYVTDYLFEDATNSRLLYNEGLELVRETKRYPEIHVALAFNNADMELYYGETANAERLLNEANRVADRSNLDALLYQVFHKKAELFEMNRMIDSMAFYFELYDSLKYAVHSAENLKASKKIETRYQVAQSELDKLAAIQQRDRENAKNQRLSILVAFLAGLMLVATLVALILRQRLMIRAKLAEANEELKSKELDKTLKEKELQRITSLMEGQEQERSRIARELHDGVGAMLATVRMRVVSSKEAANNQTQSSAKTVELIDNALDEVRKTSHNMASMILSKFGLKAALEEMIESIREVNELNVKLIVRDYHGTLENSAEMHVFRICQELIGNTIKHSKATELIIQLIEVEGELNILVEDNGIGFSPEKARTSKSLGLENINARTKHLHGTLEIDSGKGGGTTVVVNIPVK